MDHRKLVAFCRDISVIREEEYRRLPRARKIEKFPSDLLSNAGLEFSGIYEDGWFSQESFVRLGARGDANRIVLRGSVPGYGALMDGTNIMKVRINDQAPQSFEIEPGNFTVAARVEGAEPTTLVRITFSRSAVLPSPDERPVSALMEAISLEP